MLELDPGQVAAGISTAADTVPVPHVLQRLGVVEQVLAGAEIQVRGRVVVAGTRWNTHLDPPELAHHGAEGVEVELHEVVKLDARQGLDGLHRAGRAADVQRTVDDRAWRVLLGWPGARADVRPLLAGRLVDERVPRDREHYRVSVRRIQVDDQEVV